MTPTASTAVFVGRRPAQRTTASTTLLWMRDDEPRETASHHWRGPHAQLVARTPGFLDYRQHHFAADALGLWPTIAGVETDIPDERRIDGVPEVTFDGPIPNVNGIRHSAAVAADEATAFARTVLYRTLPFGGRWFDTVAEGSTGARTVMLLRRRTGGSRSEFARTAQDVLGATLAGTSGITEVRSQLFAPWQQRMWNTPRVAHDNPAETRYHAVLFVGARDQDALSAALAAPHIADLAPALRLTSSAIHAYPVEATYVYRQDGRPTLPQTRPESKPRLDPVRRSVVTPRDVAGPTGPLPPSHLIPMPGAGGAEDVVIGPDGSVLAGLGDGQIVSIDPASEKITIVADTGGRPLGLQSLPDGRILVCDAHRGLLRVDPSSDDVETLVQYVDDVPLRFCSNATVQSDGTIWFTESTSRFDFEQYLGALLEHRPSGRLFRRDPDGTVHTVLANLHFANGVALTPDESALLYAETGAYSISKLWLTGPKQGRTEIVRADLPGFPDNISSFVDGKAWFALPNGRNAGLDKLGTAPAILRKMLWRIPDNLQPAPRTTTRAMAIDQDGALVDEIHGDHPQFHSATGVAELDGRLYLVGPESHDLVVLDRA